MYRIWWLSDSRGPHMSKVLNYRPSDILIQKVLEANDYKISCQVFRII